MQTLLYGPIHMDDDERSLGMNDENDVDERCSIENE
jgi:hypothetical protein